MSFLDATTARKDEKQIVALHEILIRAYPREVDAMAIAGSVGILEADIAVYPKMRATWWSVLEESTKVGALRKLVYNVLQDPTVAGFHADVRNLLDIPDSELSKAVRPQVHRGKETRKASFRPTIGARAPLWPPGHVLKVRFLDGDLELHQRVEQAAQQWVKYANLQLDFGDYPDAEIRISFQLQGSWSYIGTTCLQVRDPQPTVNFGWLKEDTPDEEIQRVVLHEFGHVLGMQHEQGNPASSIKWNKEVVYKDLTGPPNFWTKDQVNQGFFAIWPPGYFPVYKVFDLESINMLPIPAKFLHDGKAIEWNSELTPLDKQFAAALYPQRKE